MFESTPLLLQGDAFGVLFFLVVAFGLLMTAAWVAVSYWVYQDARERNNDNPELWAVVVFFLGVPGVLVWLLVRDDL